MTVPCSLADNTIYRENARHSARSYALRAASGAARSRHAPYITTRKRAFSTNWGTHSCVPCGLPVIPHHRDGCGGRHICRPYKSTRNVHVAVMSWAGRAPPLPRHDLYCLVGRGDPTPPGEICNNRKSARRGHCALHYYPEKGFFTKEKDRNLAVAVLWWRIPESNR